MSAATIGASAGAAACVAVSPYLARLTLSVADRSDRKWRTGRPAGRARILLTALVALVVGGLAGAAAGWSALLPAFLVLAVAGVALSIVDFEQHRLPDRLMTPLAVGAFALLALAAAVRQDWDHYERAVEAAAATFALLLVMYVLAARSFGLGDVKLGGVLGCYLGWHGWLSVYYGIFAGFLLGALVTLPLVAARRASMKTAFAFGPMLLLGALIVLAFDISPALLTT